MAGGHEAIRKRIGMAFTALRNQGVAMNEGEIGGLKGRIPA